MAYYSRGEADRSIVILIPLFNDWASFAELVDRLDVVLLEQGLRADVLVVDDGSTIGPSADGVVHRLLSAVRRVDVLGLRRNLGHQRAIAIGLAYEAAGDRTDGVRGRPALCDVAAVPFRVTFQAANVVTDDLSGR